MRSNGQSRTPLSEPVFFILLSLSSGKKHGYAILKEVEEMSGGSLQLSTSTLYSALTRLEDQGLVERVAAETVTAPGLPRKVYALTPDGLQALRIESRRLQHLARLSSNIIVDESQ